MKYLIFLLLILTLLTVDHPQVNQVRNFIVNFISQTAEDTYAKDKIADLIGDELSTSFDSFKDIEEKYVKEITSSTDKLLGFYQDYCQDDKFNPNISNFNLKTVCEAVSKRKSELEDELSRGN